MAKISPNRRISTEDYEGENQQLVESLAYNLNPFMQEVTDVINGNLDFDNLKQNKIQAVITVDSTGRPISGDQINTGLTNPIGFQIISAVNQTNPAIYASGQPFISFSPQGNGIVKINNISNLPANNKFLLTIVVY